MKSKAMKEVAELVGQHWGEEFSQNVIDDADARWQELCAENSSACKAKKAHFIDNIFPCISYYEALQKHGIPQQEALEFMDECWSRRAQKGAESMRSMLRFCGLYKLYPMMFRFVAKQQFGSKAGFAANYYDCGKDRCKFDMTRCLFLDTCTKYGCPELTQCFCHTDDINNENLHPRLCWNRTQFMGNGGDLCDFDIYVTKK